MQHRRWFSSWRCSLLRNCVIPQRSSSTSENILQPRRGCPGSSQDGPWLSAYYSATTPQRGMSSLIVFFYYYCHFSLLTRPYLSIINAISIVRGCDNQPSTRFALKNGSKTNFTIKSTSSSEVAVKTFRSGTDNVRTRHRQKWLVPIFPAKNIWM